MIEWIWEKPRRKGGIRSRLCKVFRQFSVVLLSSLLRACISHPLVHPSSRVAKRRMICNSTRFARVWKAQRISACLYDAYAETLHWRSYALAWERCHIMNNNRIQCRILNATESLRQPCRPLRETVVATPPLCVGSIGALFAISSPSSWSPGPVLLLSFLICSRYGDTYRDGMKLKLKYSMECREAIRPAFLIQLYETSLWGRTVTLYCRLAARSFPIAQRNLRLINSGNGESFLLELWRRDASWLESISCEILIDPFSQKYGNYVIREYIYIYNLNVSLLIGLYFEQQYYLKIKKSVKIG